MKKKFESFIDLCDKKYNILMYFSFSLVFMYIYNIGFKEYIYPNQIVIILNFVVAGLLAFFANFKVIINQSISNKNNKKIIIVIIIALLFILLRNGDIINGHFGAPFYSLYALFLIFVLSCSNRWYKIFKNVIIFFTIEHIMATIFCFLFPNLYFNNIMPLFPKEVKPMLISQFHAGQIAGITQHYSTNALYLVVGFIINVFDLELRKKSKKNIFNIVFLSLNFFALLLTGKRVQVFFSIFSIIFVLILKNRNNMKKIVKKIVLNSILVLAVIFIISFIVPNIMTPLRRTVDGIINGDLFDSRLPLYELAIDKFCEKPIFGYGWGNYKYIYKEVMVEKEMDMMDTHNIYLQILCELGIVGFIFFILIFIYLLISSIKILLIFNKKKTGVEELKLVCTFLAMHVYFLLEGFLGNPLYDVMIYMPYVCLLAACVQLLINKNKYLEEEK